MIPLRVIVKNFLCYAKQEFEFDGHPVWLLHGPNGVGKSAVFDAMVYALFGEHRRREGSRNAVADLVRCGESSMRVDFDFECHGRRYRVWRTRTRSGQVRQGVGEFLDGNPTPRPLSHVNRDDELVRWVSDTLGLNLDTFVSAVLLRQGAAERLIDAKKEDRRDVFRGIIDLDPYIRLHEAVTKARTDVGGEVRSLRATLQGMSEVTEEQIAAATAARDETTTAWERARAEAGAARDWLAHARLWDGLNETCRALRQQLDAARDRAARAAELGRAVERLRELRAVIPLLARIMQLRSVAEAAEGRLFRLTEHQRGAKDRLTALRTAAEQEQQKEAAQGNRVAELDRDIGRFTADRDRLREQIRQAEQVANLHRRLGEQRGKQFDSDLDEQLAKAEQGVTAAQAARDASPHLEALLRHRTAYRGAAADARTARDAEAGTTEDLVRGREAERQAARFADAEEQRAEEARRAAAIAASRLIEAHDRLTEFRTLAGQAVCPRCRQSIRPEHVEGERRELERAVRNAETEAERRREESRTATEAAAAARQAAREREAERRRIEHARDEAARTCQDAEVRAKAARTSFESARAELYPELRERVGGIAADGFPGQEDVNSTRETGRLLYDRTRCREELRDRCHERNQTAETIRTLEQAIVAVGAPADVTAAQAKCARIEEYLEQLSQARAIAEEARLDAKQAGEDLTGRVYETSDELNRLTGDVGGAEADARTARRTYDDAMRALPDGAMTWDAVALDAERQELEEANVERDFGAIAEDLTLQADREWRLAETERQIEEQVPPGARRPPAEVEPEVTSAEAAVQEVERIRDAARDGLAELTRQREQREETLRRLSAVERNHALHQRLADLLGPQGIQLDLVRRAERRIIDLANETLGRVSRGELRFEPPDPTATQALDLSFRRIGCPDPIPAANLSGGQRCRVAIALALAVCRFACGEAQPLQSVIIDEAFANLDRDGRMAMIDVIRDGQIAGTTLRRIILVSHHEDVAAAFPVGYRLRSEAGTTVVEPLPSC